MFSNRKLEVKMVKVDPKMIDPNGHPITEKLDITETVSDITDSVVSGAITIVASYMAADTIRKIVIHTFTRG